MEKIKLNLGAGYRHYGDYINIDKYVTPQMIEDLMIKGDITVFKHPTAEFVQADMKALPFADNSVDYIESLDTIDHFGFREVGQVIKEMHRVLKPGSMCRVQVINFDSLAKFWTLMFEQKGPYINVTSDWMFAYYIMVQATHGNQLTEGLYKKSIWSPPYASFMFMQEIKFSSINIINIPPNQSHTTPLEVAYMPTVRTVLVDEMLIEAVK